MTRRFATVGMATGCGWDSLLWRTGWSGTPGRDGSATVIRRPWRMCAWCPRYSMQDASPSTLNPIRASWESMPLAANCRSSKVPPRIDRLKRQHDDPPGEHSELYGGGGARDRTSRLRTRGRGVDPAERAGSEFFD